MRRSTSLSISLVALYGVAMQLFLLELMQGSADHSVEVTDDGVVIHRKGGHVEAFDALARQVMETVGDFAAFPRKDEDGHYDCVFILTELRPLAPRPTD